METKEIFETIMSESQEIALSSSVGNQSDVRLVSFIYYQGKIYFSTIKGSAKTNEFENPKVSFTTLLTSLGVVRVKHGLIQLCEEPPTEVKAYFDEHPLSYIRHEIKEEGDLQIYQISFETAIMTTKDDMQTVTLNELV